MSFTPVGEAIAGPGSLPRAAVPDFLNRPAGDGGAASPPDPSEGLAFALWNEGRKEEAIAFLERQIALQKEPIVPVGALSPRGWLRLPVKAGIAAVMLLAIGGALWGGLNPSGIDPDSSARDVPERRLETAAAPAIAVSVTPADTAAARPEEGSTPTTPLLAATEPPVEEPAREESTKPPARTVAEKGEATPETGLATLAPASDPVMDEDEASADTEDPVDEMSEAVEDMGDEPLRAIVAKASQNAGVAPPMPEARLPKPRPEISAGEAMALVRPPRKASAPVRRTPVRERREVQAYAPPPQIYAPPPEAGVPGYGPYGQPGWIIVNPRLAERRAAAEYYIAQRRARAERRPVQEYGPIYYDVRPLPY